MVSGSTLYGYGSEMGDAYSDGIQIYAPQSGDLPVIRIVAESEVDMGGGALGSTGGNVFRGNAGYAVNARDTSGRALSRTFHAMGNDWGICAEGAIRARIFGQVRVERPLGCGAP